MAQDNNSFDIVSNVDLQEVRNAVSQAEKEVANRYDLVDNTAATGASVNWTDPTPGSGTHTYYVTAVDARGAESAMTTGLTR